MIGWIPVVGLLAFPAAWETYVEAGAQIDADPHGVLNVGFQSEAFRAQLLTDTLELTYSPSHSSGRSWAQLRLQGFAAEMLISPWQNGDRDRSRALVSMKAEIDAGWIEYLSHGFYVAATVSTRGYLFFAGSDDTTRAVPDPTARFSPGCRLGWWSDALRVEVSARAHVGGARVAMGVDGLAVWSPRWTVAPHVEARFGAAENLDELTLTRLGGLNPYVVPLAGAAWAEWWVEEYAALRAGPRVTLGMFELTAFVDAARFDETSAVGFGLSTVLEYDDFFFTIIGGYAPFIDRAPGVSRVSGWLLAGTRWMSF